jgi:hypothetical protein
MSKKKPTAKKPKGDWADDLLNLALGLVAEVGSRIGIHAFDRFFGSSPADKVEPEEPIPASLPKDKGGKRKAKVAKIIKMPPPWWKVLGISETSALSEIKKAYREQMMMTHPDKVAHLSKKLQRAAELEAKKLNQAYEDALSACDRSDR